MLRKRAPTLGDWSAKYLDSVSHQNTRRRYASSRANLISFFGESTKLRHLTGSRIADFTRKRRTDGLKPATINRDLRFLAQILKQAERERYIGRSPFDLGKFFANELRDRRTPLILSDSEQERLLAVARPRIRALTVLGVETGMRTGEMLALRWADIDFLQGVLRVEKSKSITGIRSVPLTEYCREELLKWRALVGTDSSGMVFPSFSNRRHPLQGGRKAWSNTLKKAGIEYFPIYNLRHTFASRLTAAGVPEITIARSWAMPRLRLCHATPRFWTKIGWMPSGNWRLCDDLPFGPGRETSFPLRGLQGALNCKVNSGLQGIGPF